MNEIPKLIEQIEAKDHWGDQHNIFRLTEIAKSLASRVEALEKRQQETAKRLNELERTVDDLVNVTEAPKGLFPEPAASGGPKRERGLKINAYLENCRLNICQAIDQAPANFESRRRFLIQALTELDAFRHGTLQNCTGNCGFYEDDPEPLSVPAPDSTRDLDREAAERIVAGATVGRDIQCPDCGGKGTVFAFPVQPAAPDAGTQEGEPSLRDQIIGYMDELCRSLPTGSPTHTQAVGILQLLNQQPPPPVAPLTGHAGDCTIYGAPMDYRPIDGICTCGYGWHMWRHGDCTHMYSKERDPEFVPAPVEPDQPEQPDQPDQPWDEWYQEQFRSGTENKEIARRSYVKGRVDAELAHDPTPHPAAPEQQEHSAKALMDEVRIALATYEVPRITRALSRLLGYMEQRDTQQPAVTEQGQSRYSVEVDRGGCERCGEGKLWVIVDTSTGVSGGTSYTDSEEAASLCEELNDAYEAGRASAQQHPTQWREAAKLVKEWRDKAAELKRDYKSSECMQKASTLTVCAYELAALLPPEKEAK